MRCEPSSARPTPQTRLHHAAAPPHSPHLPPHSHAPLALWYDATPPAPPPPRRRRPQRPPRLHKAASHQRRVPRSLEPEACACCRLVQAALRPVLLRVAPLRPALLVLVLVLLVLLVLLPALGPLVARAARVARLWWLQRAAASASVCIRPKSAAQAQAVLLVVARRRVLGHVAHCPKGSTVAAHGARASAPPNQQAQPLVQLWAQRPVYGRRRWRQQAAPLMQRPV
jgi:hypothetical protein